MRRGPWTRVGASGGEAVGRVIVSVVVLSSAVLGYIAAATADDKRWTLFVWPTIITFLAWRYIVLGLYVGDWGVRISNPVLTYWYPWRSLDRFELGSTGEMFSSKATGIVVVAKRGRRILAWALTTSRIMPGRLTEDQLDGLLASLNARIDAIRAGRSPSAADCAAARAGN